MYLGLRKVNSQTHPKAYGFLNRYCAKNDKRNNETRAEIKKQWDQGTKLVFVYIYTHVCLHSYLYTLKQNQNKLSCVASKPSSLIGFPFASRRLCQEQAPSRLHPEVLQP